VAASGASASLLYTVGEGPLTDAAAAARRQPRDRHHHPDRRCCGQGLRPGKPPEGQLDGSEGDESDEGFGEVLEILGEAPVAHEPGKGALDHPTTRQHDEALYVVVPLDDSSDAAAAPLPPLRLPARSVRALIQKSFFFA
jgi:hypothetical protein